MNPDNPDYQMLKKLGASLVKNNFQPNPPPSSAVDGAVQQMQTPQLDYQAATQAGYSPVQIRNFIDQNPHLTVANAPDKWDNGLTQDTIVPSAAPVTETFGQYQPGVEVFSGGVTPGLGLGVDTGTPIALPDGKWQVLEAYNQATGKGIGDGENEGWGNSVVAQNKQTGDRLRFSHLSRVDVQPGDELNGKYIIGLSGETGNTTGPHLNLAYYDPNGQLGDVLASPYAKYLPLQQ